MNQYNCVLYFKVLRDYIQTGCYLYSKIFWCTNSLCLLTFISLALTVTVFPFFNFFLCAVHLFAQINYVSYLANLTRFICILSFDEHKMAATSATTKSLEDILTCCLCFELYNATEKVPTALLC